MAVPLLGFDSYIMIGEESTWGTPVTRTNTLDVTRFDFKQDPGVQVRETLRSGLGNARSTYLGNNTVTGSFEGPLTYENWGMVLKAAIGSAATAGAGPYTHDYDLVDPKSGTIGLSLEMVLPNLANSRTVAGFTVTRFTLSCGVGSYVMAKVEGVGKSMAAAASKTSVSIGSGQSLILHSQFGGLSWNSLTLSAESVEVSFDRKLGTDRRFVGSANISQPYIENKTEIMLRATVEADATLAYSLETGFEAGTQSDIAMVWTGSGNNQFTINGHQAQIMDLTRSVDSTGRIKYAVVWRAISDGSQHGLNMEMINDNTAATAN